MRTAVEGGLLSRPAWRKVQATNLTHGQSRSPNHDCPALAWKTENRRKGTRSMEKVKIRDVLPQISWIFLQLLLCLFRYSNSRLFLQTTPLGCTTACPNRYPTPVASVGRTKDPPLEVVECLSRHILIHPKITVYFCCRSLTSLVTASPSTCQTSILETDMQFA